MWKVYECKAPFVWCVIKKNQIEGQMCQIETNICLSLKRTQKVYTVCFALSLPLSACLCLSFVLYVYVYIYRV